MYMRVILNGYHKIGNKIFKKIYPEKYICKTIYEKLAGCPVGPPHQHRDLPTNTDGEGDCVASSAADEKETAEGETSEEDEELGAEDHLPQVTQGAYIQLTYTEEDDSDESEGEFISQTPQDGSMTNTNCPPPSIAEDTVGIGGPSTNSGGATATEGAGNPSTGTVSSVWGA